MLRISAVSLIMAIVCAFFGFAWPGWDAIWAALHGLEIFKIGFVVFTVMFLVTGVAGFLVRP